MKRDLSLFGGEASTLKCIRIEYWKMFGVRCSAFVRYWRKTGARCDIVKAFKIVGMVQHSLGGEHNHRY